MTPICPYCGNKAKLVDSSKIYGHKKYGMFWLCRDCVSWVGTHENSPDHKPLGRLANAELREWKIKAHDLFDRLWNIKIIVAGISKGEARKSAYKWLSETLDIPPEKCHIGMMDVDDCKRVFELCRKYL